MVSIGIDLGTTNSVMSMRTTEVKVLRNSEAENLTPSVVGVRRGSIIIGSRAVDNASAAPVDTVFSIKRLMGRSFSDPEVQTLINKVNYRIVKPTDGTEADVRVILGTQEYSPIDISSMILKKLKDDAEMQLGEKATYAVITVPAYFNEKQRDATRKAGWEAGFIVKDILDEPSAAAIAYGVENIGPEEQKTILVYDLGGGTFDVSVMTVAGGMFAQMNTEGDMWLGGNDFDNKIVDYIVDKIKQEYNLDPRSDKKFMVMLQKECEKAKIMLTNVPRTDIMVTAVLKDKNGNLIDIDYDITREKFEQFIKPMVDRSIRLVRTAIERAGISKDEISAVLLVGGSTLVPMVQKAVVDEFGADKVMRKVNPMEAVAQGAGIYSVLVRHFPCPKCLTKVQEGVSKCPNCGMAFDAIGKAGKEIKQDIVCNSCHAHNPPNAETCEKCGARLKDIVGIITPMPFGICVEDQDNKDKFVTIIEKGTPITDDSVSVTRSFRTPDANIRRLKVEIFQGENSAASKNNRLGTVWVLLPRGVPKGTPIDVAISLDSQGILKKAVVKVPQFGIEVENDIDRGSDWKSKAEEELFKLEESACTEGVSGSKMNRITEMIDDATACMSRNDKEGAERIIDDIENKIKEKEEKSDDYSFIVDYAERMLNDYGWLISDNGSTNNRGDKIYGKNEIRSIIESLKKAIKSNDKSAMDNYKAQLNKAIDNAGVGSDLMYARLIERALIGKDDATSRKLNDLRMKVEASIRADLMDDAKRYHSEMISILNNPNIMKVLGDNPVRGPEEPRRPEVMNYTRTV